MFATSSRKYPIYFHYPWSEDDTVEIEMPAGFAPDNAESPAPFGSGAITGYKPVLAVTTDNKKLVYKRAFFFGGGETIFFPVSSYPQLKNYFDAVSKEDNHSISLKQASTN